MRVRGNRHLSIAEHAQGHAVAPGSGAQAMLHNKGGTLGAGLAFRPQALQGFGRPVSLFVEYQHTWWEDTHLDAPAASPFFNYTFRRDDDAIRGGVTVTFGGPPQPPPRLITK